MPDYTPEQWAQIHANAKAKLLANPQDARARAAFQAAEQFMVTQRQAANAADAASASRGPIAAGASGAADVMSFGLGPKIARGMYPSSEGMIQEATTKRHRAADIIGKVLGFVGPAGVEAGVIKGIRAAPTAIEAAVNAIRSPLGRATAKTALRGVEGAAYGAAQAAGHDEPVGRGAAIGGIAAAGLPLAFRAGQVGFNRAVTRPVRGFTRALSETVERVAGTPAPAAPAVKGLLGVGEDIGAVPMQARNIPSPRPLPDAMDVPTFLRRGVEADAGTSVQAYLRMSAREFNAAKAELGPQMWARIAKLRRVR